MFVLAYPMLYVIHQLASECKHCFLLFTYPARKSGACAGHGVNLTELPCVCESLPRGLAPIGASRWGGIRFIYSRYPAPMASYTVADSPSTLGQSYSSVSF